MTSKLIEAFRAVASPTTSYDDVPYTSFPYPRSHPDRLCMIARLFGIDAVLPARARVLELGCAAAGNLAPMAEHLPNAEFVGVDLSARQIEAGRALVAAAGLTNVALHHASITDVDASWGPFDYVICHGVYSWVPRNVQDAILRICRECTTPHGVGYVSYNTYPGWHLREMVRHMMRYHVSGLDEPIRRMEQARALINFLVGAVAQQSGPYALLLQQELELLSKTGDAYLYHEHLEEDNRPLYFHEFVARLRECGLQYLGESDVHMMSTRGLPDDVRETLERVALDLVSMEQYSDFVRNRQFRASLICRAELPLQRNLAPASVQTFRVGFAAPRSRAAIDLAQDLAQQFENAEGRKVTSSESITKAALVVLRQLWPLDLAFEELLMRARRLLAESGIEAADEATQRASLAADVLECVIAGGGIELRCEPPALVTYLSPRPRAGAVARLQAERDSFATSGRHQRLALDPLARALTLMADGEHDSSAMLEQLLALVSAGTLTLSAELAGLAQPAELRSALASAQERSLSQLAVRGLFEA